MDSFPRPRKTVLSSMFGFPEVVKAIPGLQNAIRERNCRYLRITIRLLCSAEAFTVTLVCSSNVLLPDLPYQLQLALDRPHGFAPFLGNFVVGVGFHLQHGKIHQILAG